MGLNDEAAVALQPSRLGNRGKQSVSFTDGGHCWQSVIRRPVVESEPLFFVDFLKSISCVTPKANSEHSIKTRALF